MPLQASAEGGASLEVLADGSVRADGPAAGVESYRLQFELAAGRRLSGFKLEALSAPSLPQGGPGRSAGGNFVLNEMRVLDEARAGMQGLLLAVGGPSATWSQVGFPASALGDGDLATGWAIAPAVGRSHSAYLPLEQALQSSGKSQRFSVELCFQYGAQHSLGLFRLSGTDSNLPLRAEPELDWSGMQQRIDQAIARGVDYLIDQQELDGSWSYHSAAFPGGQTALALYTLLKQRVPLSHPSVQRALAYLRAELPNKTYTMGCLLLALSSTNDPTLRPWMEELAQELVAWQHPGPDWQKGGYAYPDGAVDISNTQYAVLGLWAASKQGIEVPRKTWLELAKHIQQSYESGGQAYAPLGFAYQPGGHISGSRTAAGVGILAILEQVLGAATTKELGLVPLKQRGLAWLAKFFTVKENARCEPGDPWLYYFLYGLERVGSLTQLEYLGGSNWYREGARFLVDAQAGHGCWTAGTAEEQPNTCFALLFLARATAPVSGTSAKRDSRTYGQDDPALDVSLRAAGDTPLRIWISSFGTAITESYAWSAAAGGGLRLRRVQFVESGPERPPAGWRASPTWRYSQRPPGEGWQQPAFSAGSWLEGRGAFGDPAQPDASLGSAWTNGELWLQKTFQLQPETCVEPAFWVRLANEAERQGLSPAAESCVTLLEDTPGFAAQLLDSNPGSVASDQGEYVQQGDLALRVDGEQRYRAQLPHWGFRIREHPRPGEYRFLRWAWRSLSGEGLMLQLAESGAFSARTLRYLSGQNVLAYLPCLELQNQAPEQWTIVTRDLWRDFGGDAVLTGLALTPMGGSACLDSMYLGRTRGDLPPLDGLERRAAAVAAQPTPLHQLSLWLNGREIYQGSLSAARFEKLTPKLDLSECFQPGENVLAAAVRARGPGAFFDLELRDRPVLAHVVADAQRPAEQQKLAAEIRFEQPGSFGIYARIALLDELNPGNPATADWVESPPLNVTIEEAFDPELLHYAADHARNLLRGAQVKISASSAWDGCPASHAVDASPASGWVCAAGDRAPALSLELPRALRVRQIQLVPQRLRRRPDGTHAQAARVEVVINRKLTYMLPIEPSEWKKSILRLDKLTPVRQLELRFLRAETETGSGLHSVGLAEVELLGEQ